MSLSPQNQYVMFVFFDAALADPAMGNVTKPSTIATTQNADTNWVLTRRVVDNFDRVDVNGARPYDSVHFISLLRTISDKLIVPQHSQETHGNLLVNVSDAHGKFFARCSF
jgi:hypothetical protein